MTPSTSTPPAPPARLPAAAQFDALHAARARSDLVGRLYAAAMGDEYPAEVAPSSSCDWPLLGLAAARLRMPPGRVLVDAGCGTGGVGLWLARALAARLVGVDFSTVAVAQAAARRPDFGLTPDLAAFHTAALHDTGLPDGFAHGAVCIDALGARRGDAVRELGRVLAPGARLVLTRSLRRGAEPRWEQQAHDAGLAVEHVDERPGEPAVWERLYRLWLDHADQLRRELGDTEAERMLHEAHRTLPALPGRRAVLLTLRRPAATPPATGVTAVRMAAPGRSDDGPASAGRTPG